MTRSPKPWNNALGQSRRERPTLALVLLFAMTLALARSAQAQTFSVLYQFTGGTDGRSPHAGLLQDSAGNLYGTTFLGGDLNCNPPYGCGTVFKLDSGGNETVLHRFSDSGDGKLPAAGLVQDPAGNFYGTTSGGEFAGSFGTVFKLNQAGVLTVLYNFTGGADGGKPFASLFRDSSGILYGTTSTGGTYGGGTVFKLTPPPTFCRTVLCPWTETVLHSFGSGTDGANPHAGLVRDSAGNFYGTTAGGGTNAGGTVFKLDSMGNESVLHSFVYASEGNGDFWPYASLLLDASDNLYGTASGQANHCLLGNSDCGTVFKLDSEGNETVLLDFHFGSGGYAPYAGLVRDTSGNLYGTTYWSADGAIYGTVFKLDTAGNESVLHVFTNGADGANPLAGLIQDSAGNFYGTTAGYEGSGNGTVFKLTP